ncbi:hypothetical protein DIPPA_32044 [Diplonema papillatum]|nr:hypothetical protein DIPPA_32044 [Diplonema papillatum]
MMAKREFPSRRIAPAWAWLRYWDEKTFLAWLSRLEWSSEGDMAAVEAAIDFELFSGLDIKAPSKTANVIHNAELLLASSGIFAPGSSAEAGATLKKNEEGETDIL